MRKRKIPKTALQLKRERIAKDLADNQARADIFREKLAQQQKQANMNFGNLLSSDILITQDGTRESTECESPTSRREHNETTQDESNG